jgi:hypothetical protein
MRYPMFRYAHLVAALLVLAAMFSASGCRSLLTTVVYLINGTDVDAEFEGLEGKRVVVLCHTTSDLDFSGSGVAEDLAKKVGILLRQKGKKIEVIDQRDVAAWTDENADSDYVEVGHALDAEMVVGIDLQNFKLRKGQTLYQGAADISITVHDCGETGGIVFEKPLPHILYPPNTGIPISDRRENEFRQQFIDVLADQIGRFFYKHDAYSDFALDAEAFGQ